MKKVLAVLLVLALVVSFGACGKKEEPKTDGKELTIGVVIPGGDHGFTGESVSHCEAEAEALMAANEGLTIVVKTGMEANDSITEIENMLSNYTLDAFMLWPNEGEALRSAAQTILDANIPLVVYDRLITDLAGVEAEVMGDNYGIGKMMGEYLTSYFADDDQVNYIRVIGDASTVGVQRSGGMDEVLDAKKFVQAEETWVGNWSTADSQALMEDWLNGKDKEYIESIDLIVTHDDEMVDGIMNALEAYTGDATINIKLITSVGGREDTLVKFEQTKYSDLKFFTCYFAPSFIRDALRLTVEYAQGDTTTHPLDANGQYLIPSFTIGNGGNTDYDFDTYRACDTYKERYSIF